MAKLPWYVSSLLESLPAKQTLCVLCCKLEMRRCGEGVLTYAYIFINQFNVLLRFRNIISKDTMLKVVKGIHSATLLLLFFSVSFLWNTQ